MADATALDVPADLAQVAEEKGIPLDLVRRGLALGFPADAIKGQLGMPGVTAEAAEQFISEQERIRAGGEITIPPELLDVAQKHEWPESLVKRALALGAGHGHSVDDDGATPGRDRAGGGPALHPLLRARAPVRGHHRQVAARNVVWVPRSQVIPFDRCFRLRAPV